MQSAERGKLSLPLVPSVVNHTFPLNGDSLITTASASLLGLRLAGGGNPLIQTTSSPHTTTGHNLLSGPSRCRSYSSSLIFFGALVCAGQKRSPARQFRMRVSIPRASLRIDCSGL